MLGQVIVQVSSCDNSDKLSPWHCPLRPGVPQHRSPLTVHEVEDEAELVGRVEGVGHADDEGAVLAGGTGSRCSASGAAGTPCPHCPSALARASPAQCLCCGLLTPVLTRDSMMRSLRARVSPCFILMRFLSKHFMAYLGGW